MPDEMLPPVELRSQDQGQGPILLLLHGVGLSHTVWKDVLPGLASEFRVIAPDLRGHGRSPNPPDSHFTFPELEGDLLRLLDSKGVESAYVVGHSGGALLALRLALDHPERVRGLVTISGAAYTDTHTRSIAQRWTETYASEGPDAFGLRILKDLYYPDWIEAHLDFADQVREAVKHQDLEPATRWNAALSAFDEKSRVASLKVPTLIIQAMDDQVVDASHGRILRQSIPGAQIRILAETGHMVPLERPQETVDAIVGFVRASEEKRAASPPAEYPRGRALINPRYTSEAMAPDDDAAQMAAKLAQLEKDLRDLRIRLATLEQKLDPRAEHPSDRTAVREKVAYDWQA